MNTLEPIQNPRPIAVHSGIATSSGRWRGGQVFVKTLVSDDHDTAARFWHEGQVVSSLHHPLIIAPLLQTDRQIIFPFIYGSTLRDLARCGPMSPDSATRVTWGILEAVAYLHSKGVTHHDLKPENVMLHHGQPDQKAIRLIDFGMSHSVDLPLDIHSGTRMGTPQFMAPEQFRGHRGEPRSDLYSVGVLLFDCLAGHPPYEDALGWLAGISENRRRLPGPEALHAIMHNTIQREIEKRPRSARELQGQIAEARRQLGLPELSFNP